MEKTEKRNSEFVIDQGFIFKSLLKRAWMIALAGVVAAAIAFVWSAFFIKPTYSSSILLYVNNTSISFGGASFSISASEITAAQSLVKTYGVILDNRTTLEEVKEKSGVEYNYKSLSKMIKYTNANGTEIMQVTVTCGDPNEAAKIANTIAEVLPVRVREIIDGASMAVVDSAVPNPSKVAPNITRYTEIGLLVGIVLSAAVIIVLAMLDNKIRDDEYILQNYDYPILARIPDLYNSGGSGYRYYYRHDPSVLD